MFWHWLPYFEKASDRRHYADLNGELLAVMDAQLSMGSHRLAESGLHGLGHWVQRGFGDEASVIINRFLASDAPLVPHLRGFAESALKGTMM